MATVEIINNEYSTGDGRDVLKIVVTIPYGSPGCGTYEQQVAVPSAQDEQAAALQEYADQMEADHAAMQTPCMEPAAEDPTIYPEPDPEPEGEQ